jgi:hypothetical protein
LSSAQTAFGKAEQYPQWSQVKYSMKMMPEQARQNRVSLSKVARQEPRNSYCYEKGKLALASVGATKGLFLLLCAFVPWCEVLLQNEE